MVSGPGDEQSEPEQFVTDKPWLNDLAQPFLDQNFSSNVTAIIDGMTTTMTNYIRTAGVKDTFANGTAYALKPIVQVSWAWLALPAILLTLSALLLSLTIIVSKQAKLPVWKDSSLPTLFHGLDENTISAVHDSRAESLKEMQSEARATRVKLEKQAEAQWRLRSHGIPLEQQSFKQP